MSGLTRTRTVKGKWYSTRWCPKCDNRLSNGEVYHSRGVCPHCGHKGGVTVCEYVTKVYRKIEHQRRLLGVWWKTIDVEFEMLPPDDDSSRQASRMKEKP